MKNPNIENANKIFIGGLSCATSQIRFKNYFEQFGPVKDWVLMVEKDSKKSRGFGFIVMKNSNDVTNVL